MGELGGNRGPTGRSSEPPGLGEVWTLVLAGGEGRRMCPFIQRWLGHPRPKQFCSFFGDRTLLGYTLQRAARMVGSDRVATVVSKHHYRFLSEEPWLPGRILVQPAARGTGAASYLGLSWVSGVDREAVVVLTPADHLVHPEEVFFQRIAEALRLVDLQPERLVLTAAVAREPNPDYGWIEPGEPPCCTEAAHLPSVRPVRKFLEKPPRTTARHCFECGCFWSTMIVVARAATLWELLASLRPEAAFLLETLREWYGRHSSLVREDNTIPGEEAWVAAVYENLEEFDFSRDILMEVPERCLLVPLEGVVWDDLGRPERLVRALRQMGWEPNFDPRLVSLGDQ
ncbi:MAG: mannose-1-phosphate guanylyltransferase [Acidobacteriota bacterium]